MLLFGLCGGTKEETQWSDCVGENRTNLISSICQKTQETGRQLKVGSSAGRNSAGVEEISWWTRNRPPVGMWCHSSSNEFHSYTSFSWTDGHRTPSYDGRPRLCWYFSSCYEYSPNRAGTLWRTPLVSTTWICLLRSSRRRLTQPWIWMTTKVPSCRPERTKNFGRLSGGYRSLNSGTPLVRVRSSESSARSSRCSTFRCFGRFWSCTSLRCSASPWSDRLGTW